MKHLKKTTYLLMALVMLMTVLQTACSAQSPSDGTTESESAAYEAAITKDENASYEILLFDSSYVHTFDIAISEEDWAKYKGCKFMIASSFCPPQPSGTTLKQMAIAYTNKAADSAIAAK